VLEASFLNLSDRNTEEGAVSVRSAWKVREHGGVTSWFQVRLAFPDGARVDALAVVNAGCLSVEDVKARPPLSLADLAVLADWLERPLSEVCGVDVCGAGKGDASGAETDERCDRERDDAGAGARCAAADGSEPDAGRPGPRRARPAWPRGVEGCRLVAREYRAARDEGTDPVLAVMNATGRGRRRALRLIAQARDAGFLSPRHARR
jgi:hypothetical protein